MGFFQIRILEWLAIPFPRDLPNPGIKPRSPALQADFLLRFFTKADSLSKPSGKHPFIILQFWRSEVWHRCLRAKICVLEGLHSFLEALGENSFLASCSFLRLPALIGSWPLPPLQSQQWWIKSILYQVSRNPSFMVPFPLLRNFVITLRPPRQFKIIFFLKIILK